MIAASTDGGGGSSAAFTGNSEEEAVKQGIALLEQFSGEDAAWILEVTTERDVAQGEALIEAGAPVDALHLIVQGLFGVFADEVEARLAVLGPGDLAGEMSFLDATRPTETVRALEDSTALVLPFAELEARAEQEPTFAARLHRAFAQVLARRLREANRRLRIASDTGTVAQESTAWLGLAGPLQEFKAAVFAANKAAEEQDGVVPEPLATEIGDQFLRLSSALNEVLTQVDNERVAEEMGLRVQQEMLPYILLTKTAERFYSKPRGYAGDFWTIELLYRNQPEGLTPVGTVIDRCFVDLLPAARAVRNRRGLLMGEIDKAVTARQGPTAQITSLACGPAREVFDAFAAREDPTELHATLLDIDLHALAYVADEVKSRGLKRQMTMLSENLIRLAVGKAKAEIANQDLVYSIGLTDYFGDELVVRLMDLIYTMLRPGGRVILGNVHTRNPSKGLMDHVLDWPLIHRTEDDMDRLYASSKFGRPSTNIRFEDEQLNMFAECVR
jgi:extracellular factor (EF) 3-hydroxypalmitic acid methyl ester biosynthesis protein